jgi:hypothetical protein
MEWTEPTKSDEELIKNDYLATFGPDGDEEYVPEDIDEYDEECEIDVVGDNGFWTWNWAEEN